MIITKSLQLNGKNLTLETGKIAKQADGSVVVKYENTILLCTVVFSKESRPDCNFLPLGVHYMEKFYASGKIPGGFIKRESKPSNKEVLTSRVIDRTIRPLFPENFHNEVQVLCTLLSYDKKHDIEFTALIGASAACALAGLPMIENVAGCRVAHINGEFVLNPEMSQLAESSLDLFVAGGRNSISMVESEAKELSEEILLEALGLAQKQIAQIVDFIDDFAAAANVKKMPVNCNANSDLIQTISSEYLAKLSEAYTITTECERVTALDVIHAEIKAKNTTESVSEAAVKAAIESLSSSIVRKMAIEGRRLDGRVNDQVRPISIEVDILPKECVHGSALFTRGETQVLAVSTLGGATDEQSIDSVDEMKKEHFMLHYNFPPYAVGEIEMLKGPGRREIGHGRLAYKAIMGVMPSKQAFPYSVRIVSEVTESNGSSSMATVCGASLALMSTGVPISSAVAGVAMGLIKEGERYAVLTDIMKDEDALGDMDFKVAGTINGVTALQMDIKISGITLEIMKDALEKARVARLHILEKMNAAISSPQTLSDSVPKMIETKISPQKIADVIGKSGSTIKSICEQTGCKIDIENDGNIKIFAPTKEAGELAIKLIADVTIDIQVGEIYTGTVDKIMAFGAIVSLPGKKSGMVHISEISNSRIEDISTVLSEGQVVSVKVLGFDEKRRIKLSIKKALTNDDSNGSVESSSDGGSSGNSTINHQEPPADLDASFSSFAKNLNANNTDLDSSDSKSSGNKGNRGHFFGRKS